MKKCDIENRFNTYLELKFNSEQTIKSYKNCLNKFLITNTKIERLTKNHLEKFLIDFKRLYSISYYNQMISCLKLLYKDVLKQPNKVNSFKCLKQNNSIQNVLTVDQVRNRIRRLSNLKHKTILCCLFLCGLRVSELLNLKIEHLDLTQKKLKVVNGKGKKDRYLPITDKFSSMLSNYMYLYKPKIFIFEGLNGKYSATSIRKICKKVDINNPHLLRHSIITHLIDEGDQQTKVQMFSGHISPKSTQKYYHLSINSLTSLSIP